MNLLKTKIRLKDEVTKDDVWSLIEEWLTKSPHYGIKSIEKDTQKTYSQDFGNYRLSILSDNLYGKDVFAARFENFEKDNTWKTDIIFTEGGAKYLTLNLSCDANDFTKDLPSPHKPHIMKLLFDNEMCYQGGELPITDKPIFLAKKDVEKCAKIMSGEIETCLPVVYVSYDDFSGTGYDVDTGRLALKLAGMAHTVIEPDKDFSFKLKKISKDFNVYNGYVGVYYPETGYKETVSLKDFFVKGFLDKQKFMDTICDAVRMAMLNHTKSDDLTWDTLMAEFHRKNWQETAARYSDKQEELNAYHSTFDSENEQLKQQNEYLEKQLNSKIATIESLKQQNRDKDANIGLTCSLPIFYHAEIADFILNILTQCKDRIPEDTRAGEILNSILTENNVKGNCDVLLKKIEGALKEKSPETRRKLLEDCGFTVKHGPHDKLIFHNEKYQFTMSNSPSDYREGRNLYSDIKKAIENNKKLFK